MRLSPVFILSIRNTGGACTDRLRGSTQTSTLIPDVDHAAVRKNLFCDRGITTNGIFLFFGKEERNSTECGGLRGSALSLVYQRWEAVFRRERMPISIDRTSIQLF